MRPNDVDIACLFAYCHRKKCEYLLSELEKRTANGNSKAKRRATTAFFNGNIHVILEDTQAATVREAS